MIPLRDHNPTHSVPFVTLLLIAACLWVYFVVQPSPNATETITAEEAQAEVLLFNVGYAAIPCEIVSNRQLTVDEAERTFIRGEEDACAESPEGRPVAPDKNVYLAVLYSMFLHGGLLHLGGNVLFLWVFGNNVEDRFGHLRYLLLYLLGGLVATVGHVIAQPDSTVPIVGASGAIAAVMGAYLVLHPNARISALVAIFPVLLRAKWFLIFWFVSQFFINPNEGIAWVAHVTGFVFGVFGGFWARGRRPDPPEVVAGERYAPRPG